MELIFNNCLEYVDGTFVRTDKKRVVLDGGSASISISDSIIFPAFCDVHVHLREPGFFYKESISSGTLASARGGFSDVFSMPNLNPVPDSVENINKQWEIINNDAVVNVHPFASITVGQKGEQLVDFESLAPLCAGFSDDGKGVQCEEMMKEAMLKAKALDKIISAHCEDNSLLFGGYIHDGDYAKAHGHRGICSESEWGPIKRDIRLAKETGCKYHVCHISTKESVELIREAKKNGVDITCETGPHYLILDDSDIKEEGRFKMNPPLRSKSDREALVQGLIDGTIDMIATDHAPHSAEEKEKGLENSAFGVVGIESAFQLMYTYFVKTGLISLEKLVEVMAINPRKRFDIPLNNSFTVWNLNKEITINPSDFLSKGRSTPFEGYKVFGQCLLTVANGKIVYNNL